MPSSSSIASMVPLWRAARKWGSSGIVSRETNAYTTFLTLPAAQRRPTSGPPQATRVRSLTGERRIPLTTDIGLRREPHPPIPIVMPSCISATISSSVTRLSATFAFEIGLSLLDESLAGLVRHAGVVQLERKTLLDAIALAGIDRLDDIDRLLGATDYCRVLVCDPFSDPVRRRAQLFTKDDLEN